MIRYWILAAVAVALSSCDGPAGIFGDSVQPEYESAFYEGSASVQEPNVNHEMTPNGFEDPDQEEMFYDLSDDPTNLRLLALDTIDGSGADKSVIVVNLFKRDNHFGLMTTWHIDCERSQMAVIRIMKFQEGGESLDSPFEMKMISTQGSPESRRMEELVCDEKGLLEKNKVYRGALTEIITRFWDGDLTPVSEEDKSPSSDEYISSALVTSGTRLPPTSSAPTSRTLS